MRRGIPEELDTLARGVVDAAFAVHKTLGPGLLESVYEACLQIEFQERGLPYSRQVLLPIEYKGHQITDAFRLDYLVGGKLIVELKAVEQLLPVHEAQLLTYLRLTGCRLDLLVNFNVPLIRAGIKRMVL